MDGHKWRQPLRVVETSRTLDKYNIYPNDLRSNKTSSGHVHALRLDSGHCGNSDTKHAAGILSSPYFIHGLATAECGLHFNINISDYRSITGCQCYRKIGTFQISNNILNTFQNVFSFKLTFWKYE